MIGKWTFPIAALPLLLGIAAATSSRADTPWSNLLATSRVEANPAKEYTLKEDHGPWIIMACSFNGENAEKQAKALVLELRKRYRMEAFVYQQDFKLDDPNGNAQSLFASPHRHQYQMFSEDPNAYRDGAIKEIAVVVGNFPAIDDPDAQRALQNLKSADPECLHSNQEAAQSRSLAALRSFQARSRTCPSSWKAANTADRWPTPSSPAIRCCPKITSLPKGGVDELVLKMNKNVKHSLLDCPGKYTVQVAHFTGEVIINQGEIQAIESGAKTGPESTKQGLAGAAEKAHELTEALRIKGWEAYEFHDRNASLVTVGSFDSVGTPRPTAKSKSIRRFIISSKSFRATPVNVAGVVGAMEPQACVGIFFDAQPILVEVPKRSISRQLSQRLDMAGQ